MKEAVIPQSYIADSEDMDLLFLLLLLLLLLLYLWRLEREHTMLHRGSVTMMLLQLRENILYRQFGRYLT